MRKIIPILILLTCAIYSQAQNNVVKGSGICYTNGVPTMTINTDTHCEVAIDTSTGYWYEWQRDASAWVKSGFRIQETGSVGAPSYTPSDKQSLMVINNGDSLYHYRSSTWNLVSGGGGGGGVSSNSISLSGNTITSTINGTYTDTTSAVGTNTLTLSSDSLKSSVNGKNSSAVYLGGYLDNTDNQTIDSLSLRNDSLVVKLQNSALAKVNLSKYLDNTDAQTLTLASTKDTLTISNGNYVIMADPSKSNEGSIVVSGSSTEGTVTTNTIGSPVAHFQGRGITNVQDSSDYILITSTEVDGSVTNELQTIDTFSISGNTISLSLSSDGQAAKTLSPVQSVSNTSSTNSLSTTVNGVTGSSVNIVNSNALSYGTASGILTSNINGVSDTTAIPYSGASANGILSSTDWNTFNNKLSSLDTTKFHHQGGNSYGAAFVAGSVDNYDVNFKVQDTTQLSLSTSGSSTFSNYQSANNAVMDVLYLDAGTPNTPAVGFGGSLMFKGKSTTTASQGMATIAAYWTDPTHITREAALGIYLGDAGGTLDQVLKLDRTTNTGLLTFGTSAPFTMSTSAFTTGSAYTIGNSSNTLSLTSSSGSAGAITISTSTTNGSIKIGGTATSGASAFQTTNSTKSGASVNFTGILFDNVYAPTSSGSGSFNSFTNNATINQTGGNVSISRGYYDNPTFTSIADYRAIELAGNSSSAYGVYQSGASTKNLFAGETEFDLQLKTKEISAPSTPASGFGYLYEKTDNKLYFKNDAGTEYDLTAASSAIDTTKFHHQNGNAYAAVSKIGTTDNYGISFITNNATRARIDTSGNLTVGASSALSISNSAITTATDLTMGGSANGLTFNSTKNSNSAILLQTTGQDANSICFGMSNFTSTSLNKPVINFMDSVTVASGTVLLDAIKINNVFNITGGSAVGSFTGVNIAPTFTSMAGLSSTYYGVYMPYSNSAAYGIFQSGANTLNYFAGQTKFNKEIKMTAISAPGTPASGNAYLYVSSSDKHIYLKDDAGTTTDLTLGSGGSGITSNVLSMSGNTMTSNINSGAFSDTSLIIGRADLTLSGNQITLNVNNVTDTTLVIGTVSNTSSTNSLSTTVNGVTGSTVNIINSNTLNLSGNQLTETINGVSDTSLVIGTVNANLAGNSITVNVNNVTDTVLVIGGVSNTSSTNSLSTTVNGITGSSVNIINSNTLSFGTVSRILTSNINGVSDTTTIPASSIDTTYFVHQYGNDYGKPLKIGETDNYGITFITNNVTRARLDTSGVLSIGESTPLQISNTAITSGVDYTIGNSAFPLTLSSFSSQSSVIYIIPDSIKVVADIQRFSVDTMILKIAGSTGTNGQVLTSNGYLATWQTPSASSPTYATVGSGHIPNKTYAQVLKTDTFTLGYVKDNPVLGTNQDKAIYFDNSKMIFVNDDSVNNVAQYILLSNTDLIEASVYGVNNGSTFDIDTVGFRFTHDGTTSTHFNIYKDSSFFDGKKLDLQFDSIRLKLTGAYGTSGQFVKVGANGLLEFGSGGGSLSDGDYTDVDVSSSGTVWTVDTNAITTIKILNKAVTLAKMDDVATSTVFYRKTAGTGVPEVQTLATLKTDLGLTGTNSGDQTITLTGDVTGSGTGSFATTIANDAVTSAKIAANTILAADVNDDYIILQGGNTIGADVSIGSKDAYSTILKVRDTTQLTIDTSGVAMLAGYTHNTTTVADKFYFDEKSYNTPAAGFGESLMWKLQSSTTVSQAAAAQDVYWTTATQVSHEAAIGWRLGNAGSAGLLEVMKLDRVADSSGVLSIGYSTPLAITRSAISGQTAGGLTITGGTAVGDSIIYMPTTANGTDAQGAHVFKVDNNGGTTAMTIRNNGRISIGPNQDYTYFVNVAKDQNAETSLSISNTTDGTGSYSLIRTFGVRGRSSFFGEIAPSNSGSLSLFDSSFVVETNDPALIHNLVLSVPEANSKFLLYTGGRSSTNERIRVTSNGYVGIGTQANATGQLEVKQTATATGALKGIVFTGAVNTNQTLSTEIPSLYINAAGRQWATGALTTQREVLVTQPTYSFVGASTITNAATVGIAGAPIKSTNATITNTHGLLIGAGAVSTATNSYGLTVNAQTGATNNYAAQFLGGNVGIRSSETNIKAYLQIGAGTATAGTAPLCFAAGPNTTAAVKGEMTYDSSFYLTKESALRFGVGGVIADFSSDIDNSGTGETDLQSYTTPANTLGRLNEKIEASFQGNWRDATMAPTMRVYFAGTSIFDSGSLTIGATADWEISVTIIRTSSTTARAFVTMRYAGNLKTKQTDLTGLTLSNTNILKVTGQAGGASGGSNDIRAKMGTIKWLPAAAN